MSRLLYYLLVKPLSLLPLSVLYGLSDALYWLVYRGLGYRVQVVRTNLQRSFPQRSPAEIQAIMDGFYAHFFDVIVETIRLFSMPAREVMARCDLGNLPLIERLHREGHSFLIVAGHYNNWELAAQSACLRIPHLAVGIYAPLRNRYLNRKFLESRARFGMELVPKHATADFFAASPGRLVAPMFGADQAPSNPHKAYWLRFLNQDTPVFYGAEHYARTYNYPVVFGHIRKLRRGYYIMEFELLSDQPALTAYGDITKAHTRALERDILHDPTYWLWTHRRWKRAKPPEMEVAD